MLSERYKNALHGMKMQAGAVIEALPNHPHKGRLARAQKLMAENDAECKHIYRLVISKGISIPDLTEEQLAKWLEE